MPDDGFALVSFREDGEWFCSLLPDNAVDDLDACIAVLRQQPGAALLFVNVEDEFFIALRQGTGAEVRVLLSDRTAAADYDVALQALGMLGESPPDDDDTDDADEVWPAGDLSIFADLGLDERELDAILDDLDLYADEMIAAIAGRIGFADAYARLIDTLAG
ncbi:MAG: tRNA adenosine deaminase-associated protein [Mycobacteriales bacterium]|nr:MAG: tRNA adenosine deaminase [Pseudonocardiales bacterium]